QRTLNRRADRGRLGEGGEPLPERGGFKGMRGDILSGDVGDRRGGRGGGGVAPGEPVGGWGGGGGGPRAGARGGARRGGERVRRSRRFGCLLCTANATRGCGRASTLW